MPNELDFSLSADNYVKKHLDFRRGAVLFARLSCDVNWSCFAVTARCDFYDVGAARYLAHVERTLVQACVLHSRDFLCEQCSESIE